LRGRRQPHQRTRAGSRALEEYLEVKSLQLTA
jgi:hypothetical protein